MKKAIFGLMMICGVGLMIYAIYSRNQLDSIQGLLMCLTGSYWMDN
jgi:hypothetical protein